VKTGKERWSCQHTGSWMAQAAVSADGQTLATADSEGAVTFWDTATGAEKWRLPAAGMDRVSRMAFAPDGRTLVVAGLRPMNPTPVICIWELASGKIRQELSGHAGEVTALAFSPDSTRLATGSHDTTLLLWDLTGCPGRK
jgi:WD40 repeat protein